MVATRASLLLAAACALLSSFGLVEGFGLPGLPTSAPPVCNAQPWSSLCEISTDKCGSPCSGKRPLPIKPDGSYDVMGAVFSIAAGGSAVLKSGFFDKRFNSIGPLTGWGYVGAGMLDGINGLIDAADDKAAWNVYKLESFVSSNTDYMICEVREIIGDYFHKYVDSQDLCQYNIGLNAMADVWLSSCGSRQCLNYTDKPSDQRGDCCDPSAQAGSNEDCLDYSADQIARGQGLCRLQDENFKPGTGVCTTHLECRKCIDFAKAIEMTQAQIDRYSEPPTNWGDVLAGYKNIDSVIAQARGTLMMIAFYQELIMLGAQGSIGNFQLFARNAYQDMQPKVEAIMSTAPAMVTNFSCTLVADVKVAPTIPIPCVKTNSEYCVVNGMGCKNTPTLLGLGTCQLRICNADVTCSGCFPTDCNPQACYKKTLPLPHTNCSQWAGYWQVERDAALFGAKEWYDRKLANVTSFLQILHNYSEQPIPLEIFGTYQKLGYRKPSCIANAASPDVLAQCQHAQFQLRGRELPHSHFHL